MNEKQIKLFEEFFHLEDYGDREQLLRCWMKAQAVKGLTFEELSKANMERQSTTLKFKQCENWTPADWVTAITGEIGEAANLIKKRKRGDEVGISEIVKELADVIVYADILLQFYHYDTGAVVAAKFNEVSDRVGSKVKI